MNPLLKRILIIIGVILAVLAIGALVLKSFCKSGKWSKKYDRYSEQSNCCKCCSCDDDDEDDDELLWLEQVEFQRTNVQCHQ